MQNAPVEHSAILSTCTKLPPVFKTFVLSIFEWQFKTGFTVLQRCNGVATWRCSWLIQFIVIITIMHVHSSKLINKHLMFCDISSSFLIQKNIFRPGFYNLLPIILKKCHSKWCKFIVITSQVNMSAIKHFRLVNSCHDSCLGQIFFISWFTGLFFRFRVGRREKKALKMTSWLVIKAFFLISPEKKSKTYKYGKPTVCIKS